MFYGSVRGLFSGTTLKQTQRLQGKSGGFININIPLEMKFTVVAHSAGDGGGGWLVERHLHANRPSKWSSYK